MHQYLHKYLILHRSLSIPQLGNFSVRDEAARPDPVSGLLFAPRPVISFEAQQEQPANKKFFSFLAKEMNTDETAAVREFHDFCYKFRERLQHHDMAVLPGVGRIVKNADEKLMFTAENSLLEFLPPVPWTTAGEQLSLPVESRKQKKKQAAAPVVKPEPVVAQTEEITEEIDEYEVPRDRWWLYAIIMLALGVLALLYYYQ